MPLGEVPHTGDHARLDGREDSPPAGTGRIRLPLVVGPRRPRCARESRRGADLPTSHRGFDEPGFGDDGQPVGLRYRRCRRDSPGERGSCRPPQRERREGVGKLQRLPLATFG